MERDGAADGGLAGEQPDGKSDAAQDGRTARILAIWYNFLANTTGIWR